MTEPQTKTSQQAQHIDLSAELNEEAASTAQTPDSSSSAEKTSSQTASSGSSEGAAQAESTSVSTSSEASAESSGTSGPPTSSSTTSGIADAPASADASQSASTGAPEQTPATTEDQEWLLDSDQTSAESEDAEADTSARSFAGTVLDARLVPIEQSWNARSLEGSVLDARHARAVEGRSVESWRFQETTLDSRAVREVKGKILSASAQRFAGTILDSRADRSATQSPLAAQNLARRFRAQSLLNPTPPTTGRFFVLLGPVPDFAFHACKGLSFSLETSTYGEGGLGWQRTFPTRVAFDPLVFTRGLVFGPGWIQLRRWRESMLGDGPPLRLNGVIIMQNDLGVPICFWRFVNGFPIKWSGPELQPGSTELAVETLEIAHEGLKVIDFGLVADPLSSGAVGMGSVMSSASGSTGLSDGLSMTQGVMSGDGSGMAALLGS